MYIINKPIIPFHRNDNFRRQEIMYGFGAKTKTRPIKLWSNSTYLSQKKLWMVRKLQPNLARRRKPHQTSCTAGDTAHKVTKQTIITQIRVIIRSKAMSANPLPLFHLLFILGKGVKEITWLKFTNGRCQFIWVKGPRFTLPYMLNHKCARNRNFCSATCSPWRKFMEKHVVLCINGIKFD